MSHTESKTVDEQDATAGSEERSQDSPVGGATPDQDEHEGATDEEVGDRTGPGAGYDMETEQEKDPGGVL